MHAQGRSKSQKQRRSGYVFCRENAVEYWQTNHKIKKPLSQIKKIRRKHLACPHGRQVFLSQKTIFKPSIAFYFGKFIKNTKFASMKKLLAYLLYSLAILALPACGDKNLEPDKNLLGYDYFPLDIGQYIDYDVKTTSYFPNNPTVTEQFQMRELLIETYTSVEGKSTHKIQRYKRANANLPWALDSTFSTHIDNFNAFRSENNRVFVKLAFPLSVGKKWNGNGFNNLKKDNNTIEELDIPRKINTFTFENTMKVVLANDSSLVYQDRRQEIYARKVGLVQSSIKILNYCTDANCIGQGKILSGTVKTQTLLNYGKLF